MGGYPGPQDLAKITVPVVCTYGSRSRTYMRSITRSLAQAIPRAAVREIDGTAHAVPFDAPGTFAQVIVEAMRSELRSSAFRETAYRRWAQQSWTLAEGKEGRQGGARGAREVRAEGRSAA